MDTGAKDTEALVRGVSPVLEVPFHDNGDLDPDGFTTVVDRVLATGVSSVMFPGFASEFHKLDGSERELLTGLLLDRTRGESGVAAVVSVPDHATRHAVAQAEAAAERGADALNVLPPHFLGPSREAVLAHVRAVLAAVDPLPVVLQYAPAQTGTALDAPTLHQLAAEHPRALRRDRAADDLAALHPAGRRDHPGGGA
ncbi:dihydrodipicolinate synthase family protein, partial [Streptomyces sp. SID10853]|nr:dihydrodipicolinate synthase family protein [Streptomyces sp. SID10853]